MSKIEITRENLEDWRLKILEVERSTIAPSCYQLTAIANMISALLAIPLQSISPLRAEVMALQLAPFSSLPLGKTIVDANNRAIGYARGMTILQQDEMHNMVCEALNEYWDKHKA